MLNDFKKKQKEDHDRHYRVRELPEIPDNTNVWGCFRMLE